MPPPDPASAAIRAEIRGWLRSMPAEERDNYLSRNIDKLDPTITAALFEGPPELAGNPPASVMEELRNRTLRAVHGGRHRRPYDLREGNRDHVSHARGCGVGSDARGGGNRPAPVEGATAE
jgi:hypothetical protein